MLSERLQEKLDRVVEIQKQMAELAAELDLMFFGEKIEISGRPMKKHVCSICNQPGHDVRKCPKGEGLHPDNPKDSRKPCPECGSMRRHFKNCSRNGKDPIPSFKQETDLPRRPADPLSEEQYADLRKAMHDRDFQSARYALVNKLSPGEVNRAVRSSRFDEYRSFVG